VEGSKTGQRGKKNGVKVEKAVVSQDKNQVVQTEKEKDQNG